MHDDKWKYMKNIYFKKLVKLAIEAILSLKKENHLNNGARFLKSLTDLF